MSYFEKISDCRVSIELNELQNHIETLASYLNGSFFEIIPVDVHASVQVHYLL